MSSLWVGRKFVTGSVAFWKKKTFSLSRGIPHATQDQQLALVWAWYELVLGLDSSQGKLPTLMDFVQATLSALHIIHISSIWSGLVTFNMGKGENI